VRFGGRIRPVAPENSLLASDFQGVDEDDLDAYPQPADWVPERRPAYPTTIAQWAKQALHCAWIMSLVYGAKYFVPRKNYIEAAVRGHEREPRRYPLSIVFDEYEEMQWAWCEAWRAEFRRL